MKEYRATNPMLCRFTHALPQSARTVFLWGRACTCFQSRASKDWDLGLTTLRPWAGPFRFQNAALFWWNLHRSGEGDSDTLHAACPVLVGDKWGKACLSGSKGKGGRWKIAQPFHSKSFITVPRYIEMIRSWAVVPHRLGAHRGKESRPRADFSRSSLTWPDSPWFLSTAEKEYGTEPQSYIPRREPSSASPWGDSQTREEINK